MLGPHVYTLSIGPDTLDDNSTGDLDLDASATETTTIEGAGVGKTSISGAGFPAKNPDRLLRVNSGGSGSVTIRDLTLTGGVAADGGDGKDGVSSPPVQLPTAGGNGASGGAILNGGVLALDDVAITHNAAGSGGTGGAGDNDVDAASGGDAGVGGGIANLGTLTLRQVSFTDNVAGNGGDGGPADGTDDVNGGAGGCCGDGGALFSGAGNVTVDGSTFTGNHAGNGGSGGMGGVAADASSTAGHGGTGQGGGSGGAIAITGRSLALTDSTLAQNFSGLGGNGGPGGTLGASGGNGGDAGDGSTGGAVFVRGVASVTLLNDTIASNQVGAAGAPGAAGTASGSAGAPGDPPFAGGVRTSGGATAVYENTLLASNELGNCNGTKDVRGENLSFGDSSCGPFATGDPKLDPLQDNGGPTETMDLGNGSAARGAGASCAPTDQRGVSRPSGVACDLGAYEVTPPTVGLSPVASVSATGAVLIGSVTANQASATVHFEFGTTTAYGKTASVPSVGGVSAQPVSATLKGLRPGTTYHYRLVASSPDGTTNTADPTFRTARARAPRITGLKLTPRRFKTPPGRGTTGTTISSTDSTKATTTLAIFRARVGVKRHSGRCVKRTAHVHGKTCLRLSKVTTLTNADRAGPNRVRFDRRLAPGNYQLAVTPRAGDQTGRSRTVSFTVRP